MALGILLIAGGVQIVDGTAYDSDGTLIRVALVRLTVSGLRWQEYLRQENDPALRQMAREVALCSVWSAYRDAKNETGSVQADEWTASPPSQGFVGTHGEGRPQRRPEKCSRPTQASTNESQSPSKVADCLRDPSARQEDRSD